MRFFRNRTFTAANLASLFMFFGMFGSIFLLAQYFQTVQGSSPLEAGLRILPWTAMPILIAPIAGLLSDRIGGRPIMATGLALQATGLAWIGAILTTTLPYSSIVIPFTLSGIGMAMYFAPVANVVLSSVTPDEEGQASGANNAIRELGGVFGVAVLAAVFSHYGGYQTPASFVHGVTPALYLGAALVAIGAATALLIPRRRRRSAEAPQIGRSGRTTRRVSLVVGVVVISAIVASTTASATTTPSTRQAAGEPVLVIPAPTGAYPVGTRSLELVDPSRHEPGTNGRKPRSLVIQLWYPRARGTGSGSRTCRPRLRHTSPVAEVCPPPSSPASSWPPSQTPCRCTAPALGPSSCSRPATESNGSSTPASSKTSPATATSSSRSITHTTPTSSPSPTATPSRSAR